MKNNLKQQRSTQYHSSNPLKADPNRLLRINDVISIIPVAKSTWWGWVAKGTAPAPVRLGRTTAWRYSDLEEFIDKGQVRLGKKIP